MNKNVRVSKIVWIFKKKIILFMLLINNCAFLPIQQEMKKVNDLKGHLHRNLFYQAACHRHHNSYIFL